MAAEDEQENEQAAHPPISGKFKKASVLLEGMSIS